MMGSRGDFNFFLGLPVGEPDAAIYLEDVTGGANSLKYFHSQVGDVLTQLVGRIDLALDIPEVADGVQSTGLDRDGDECIGIEVRQLLAIQRGHLLLHFHYTRADVRRGGDMTIDSSLTVFGSHLVDVRSSGDPRPLPCWQGRRDGRWCVLAGRLGR